MKTFFILFSIFTYCNANIYTITVNDLQIKNDEIIMIQSRSEAMENKDEENATIIDDPNVKYTVIRETIHDSVLLDGVVRIKSGEDYKVRKVAEFCDANPRETAGTAIFILQNALGFPGDTPCPIDPCVLPQQKTFRITEGEYSEIMNEGVTEVTIEVDLPGLLCAEFKVEVKEGPVTEDDVDDEGVEDKEEDKAEFEGDGEGDGEGGGEEGGSEGEGGSEEGGGEEEGGEEGGSEGEGGEEGGSEDGGSEEGGSEDGGGSEDEGAEEGGDESSE